MINQATVRTGFKYGVLCALVGMLILIFLYLVGANPFGYTVKLSALLLPVFIFLGTSRFKKYKNPDIGFLKAFGVALLITGVAAILSALLVLGFANLAGEKAMSRHRLEMKALLQDPTAQAQTIKLAGKGNYDLALENLEKMTPLDVAADDLYKKLGIGFLFSIVAATFYRK